MAPQLSGKSFKAVSRSKTSIAAGKPLPSKKDIGGALQKSQQGFQGPVAGYISTEKEKTTKEIIDDFTKGEQQSPGTREKNSSTNTENVTHRGRSEHQQNTTETQTESSQPEERLQEEEKNLLQDKYQAEAQLTISKPVVLPAKKLGGLGLFIVFIVSAVKDAIDIVWEIIEIFADFTIVLGILMWVISTLADIVVLLVSNLYFWLEDVRDNSIKNKARSVALITEILPIAGFLPAYTVALYMIVRAENKKREEEVRQKEQAAMDEYNMRVAQAKQSLTEAQEGLKDVHEKTRETRAFYDTVGAFQSEQPRMHQKFQDIGNNTYAHLKNRIGEPLPQKTGNSQWYNKGRISRLPK